MSEIPGNPRPVRCDALSPRAIRGRSILWVALAIAVLHASCIAMYRAGVESGTRRYVYVPGINLKLAWLPLVFAVATHAFARRPRRSVAVPACVCAGAWLVFLPNAPYVITDPVYYGHASWHCGWYDGLMLGAFVATGVLLGLASVYVMHGVCARAVGPVAAWAVVLGTMPLSGFGIYLGRVHRWNSWDVVRSPWRLLADLVRVATDPALRDAAALTTLWFGAFMALAYVAAFATVALSVRIGANTRRIGARELDSLPLRVTHSAGSSSDGRPGPIDRWRAPSDTPGLDRSHSSPGDHA